MDRLFEHPVINVATVCNWLGRKQAGANTLVSRLEKIGVLREITGFARYRRFFVAPYLQRFHHRQLNRPRPHHLPQPNVPYEG